MNDRMQGIVAKNAMQIRDILYARHRFTAGNCLMPRVELLKGEPYSESSITLNKEEEKELVEYLKFRLFNNQSPETDKILVSLLTTAMVVQVCKVDSVGDILYTRCRLSAEKYFMPVIDMLKEKPYTESSTILSKEEEKSLIDFLKSKLYSNRTPKTDKILASVLSTEMAIQLRKTGPYVLVVEENYDWIYPGI